MRKLILMLALTLSVSRPYGNLILTEEEAMIKATQIGNHVLINVKETAQLRKGAVSDG